jgi:outer membrane protein OmpA-like peptidoglycan-associated protein
MDGRGRVCGAFPTGTVAAELDAREMRYLELGAHPSQGAATQRFSETMRVITLKTGWAALLTHLAIANVGLMACHSMRMVPSVSITPSQAIVPARNAVVKLRGHVYSTRDSTTALSGAELIFSRPRPDSAAQRWRNLTGADGSFQVVLPAGFTCQIELNKDGRNIETQEYAVPEGRTDTIRVIKNFYLDYLEEVIHEPGMTNIFFDVNQAALRPEARERIKNIVLVLKSNPEIGCVIEGHAEPREAMGKQLQPEEYLSQLGQRRAQAAYTYMVKMGIPASRLNFVSHGARRPAALNDTPDDRQLNRRVEFKSVELAYIPATGSILKPVSPQKISQAAGKGAIYDKRNLEATHANRPIPRKKAVRSSK